MSNSKQTKSYTDAELIAMAKKVLDKKEEQKVKDLRYNTRNRIFVQKAIAAKIIVTEQEITDYLKTHK